MAALPKFVVLQSKFNNKNLEILHFEGTRFHGYIGTSGGDTVVMSPYTKLEVEVSQSDNNLVHLKNCYHNKYWVASPDQEMWIHANANEPEEDQTKLSCTLFRPVFDHGHAKMVRLEHVNLGKTLYLGTIADPSNNVMLLGLRPFVGSNSYAFKVIDWSSIMLLPRNVGFKVYKEDKYLSASPVDGLNYLKFVADNKWSPEVRQEVLVTGDGSVMIKSMYYKKYWACADTSIILANGDNTPSDKNLLFRPESVGEGTHVIGLLNVGDHDYCKRLIVANDEKITNVISAADGVVTDLSKLEVIELVTSRLVDNVDFKTRDAKINATKVVVLDTQEAVNTSSQKDEIDVELKFSWKPTSSSTWSSIANGSLRDGIEILIHSKIPSVQSGHIIYSEDEYKSKIVWGEAQLTTRSKQTATFTVKKVSPKTKITVKAMGNMDSLEVPFFYTQNNIVNSAGTIDNFEMEDGNYTGSSISFDNSFEVEVTQLP